MEKNNLYKVLDGKSLADFEIKKIKREVEDCNKNYGRVPKLAVILVGENPASKIYVASKEKKAKECGIDAITFKLPQNTTKKELEDKIENLNNDKNIDAILLQLPLPDGLDDKYFISKILPSKDVDCLTAKNQSLIYGNENPNLFPCTPYGVIKLIDFAISIKGDTTKFDELKEMDLSSKNVLVIGRSSLVGKPLSFMLLNKNATVTMAHSKSKNLESLTKDKDIIISCVGKPNILSSDNIKDGAILIDVGINKTEDGKIIGDLNFKSFENKNVFITPVPKGVGPMTIAMLMENTVKCYKMHCK